MAASIKKSKKTVIITLEDILSVNRDRNTLKIKLTSLEGEFESLTDPTEIENYTETINLLKEQIKVKKLKETELLKKADPAVVSRYKYILKHPDEHTDFRTLASQVPETSESGPSYSGYRSSVPEVIEIDPPSSKPDDPLGSSSDSADDDNSRTSSQNPAQNLSESDSLSAPADEKVDTSPGTGFATFGAGIKTKRNKSKNPPVSPSTFEITKTSTNPPDPPKRSKKSPDMATTTVLSYSPPSFGAVYKGTTNVDKFFTRYEAFASAYKWDDPAKLNQLEFHLAEAALKCFNNIRKTSAKADFTYDNVKATIKKYFASKTSSQEYEKQLRERKLLHNESMESYFWDVIDLVYKIYKTVEFNTLRDQVLKGLPADTAKDIWNAQPSDMEELHEKILERQKFESLMGKKTFGTDENAVQEFVNHLENLGFKVTKENKQEVNKFAHKKRKGNFRKQSSSNWFPSGPQSSNRSQSHPRDFSQNQKRERNSFNRYPYNNNNSWRQQGRTFESNSRRYDPRPQNGSFRRPQQSQRFPQNRQFNRYPRNNNYVNNYENYDPYENYETQRSRGPGQAYESHSNLPPIDEREHHVNTVSGNSFL